MTTTRSRPTTLPSTTTRLRTERGNLYVTISTDDDGEPFEVFGTLGKAGSFEGGVTELACRLVSLHLRRGTPLEEIVDQCQGHSRDAAVAEPAQRRYDRVRPRAGRRHRARAQRIPEVREEVEATEAKVAA